MFSLLRLTTCVEYSGQQNDMIVYNTKDVYSNPQWDISKHTYYYIHNCQFNDVGDINHKSCLDFQDGNGSQYIDVYSCIITYGRGYWGGGIYFYGYFNFNIRYICIYSCKSYDGNAIAYLEAIQKSGQDNKFNLTYLSSSHCYANKDPLRMKNYQEYSNSNVSFTPSSYATYGVVCVESVHDYKKYNYNSFFNNTSPVSIVYFYQMSYTTVASNCVCIGNVADTYSIIIHDQREYSNGAYLHLENFYIFGNNYKSYYTYETYIYGKIVVENCTADSHKASKSVTFVGETITVTSDNHPIYPYYGTALCDAIHPVTDETAERTPEQTIFQTPFETAIQTPYLTVVETPFETAIHTPIETALNTPYDTAAATPYETEIQTPFVTLIETPIQTAYQTPYETAIGTPISTAIETHFVTIFETPIDTVFQTLFETVLKTPFETIVQTPIETILETPFKTAIQTPFESEEKTPDETVCQTASQTYFETPFHTAAQTNYETPFPTQTNYETSIESESHIETYTPVDSTTNPGMSQDISSMIQINNQTTEKGSEFLNQSSENGPKQQSKNHVWIIITSVLTSTVVLSTAAAVYYYKKHNSHGTDSSSPIEMLEETVVTPNQNISMTIENPLFTTSVCETDDPFRTDFSDSNTEGLFHIAPT